MLATRMFFWWDTVFVDPMTPAVTVPAATRLYLVPASTRVFEVKATEPTKD